MLSEESVQDFNGICMAVRARAIPTAHEKVSAAKSQAVSHGAFISTGAAFSIDGAVTSVFQAVASELIDALQLLSAAEPVRDGAGRHVQLRELIERQLRLAGKELLDVRDQHLRPILQSLSNSWNVSGTEGAIEASVVDALGRIGLAVKTQANALSPIPSVVHSPVIHGSVGSYQAGSINTSTVHELVVTHAAPAEVVVALNTLIEALRAAEVLPITDRKEAVDVLEEIRAEVGKDNPNRTKLGGLIGGVATSIQTLAAAPEAWKVIVTWYETLKSAVLG